MWKPEHRIAAAARRGLRYPSDMSDAEWALVEPMIPPGRRGGRPRGVNLREVLNAIFYVLATGCQWQALPKDLPPKSTACLSERTLTGSVRLGSISYDADRRRDPVPNDTLSVPRPLRPSPPTSRAIRTRTAARRSRSR